MKTIEELKSADKLAAEKLQETHLAWVYGSVEDKPVLLQARNKADEALMAIRHEMAALPKSGDVLLRIQQGEQSNRATLDIMARNLEKDRRTSGIRKTQAELDREYDQQLERENE